MIGSLIPAELKVVAPYCLRITWVSLEAGKVTYVEEVVNASPLLKEVNGTSKEHTIHQARYFRRFPSKTF